MSPKKVKLILSFVIGMVLSLITVLLIEYSTLVNLAIIVLLWIAIGMLAYSIVLKASNSKGISGLSGIIIGGIGMWILTNILGNWVEAVELADSGFGVFLLLLPCGLIWTFIIYTISNSADKNNPDNND